MEFLFDFSLGEPSPLVRDLRTSIDNELNANQTYQDYLATLTEEEDRLELETEERLIRLAEALVERFDSFQTRQQKLYGKTGEEETLLYEIDLI